MIKAIAIDDEPLALNVINALCSEIDYINLERTFTKPTEALKHLRNYPVDLIFLDIKMPSITGINLAKSLPQGSMVIFTTAYNEFAVESYELNAIDYLLKPINQQRFSQAATKAFEYFKYLNNKDLTKENNIFLRADFSLIKIPLNDILFIEGMADYVKVYIKDRKTVVARMTMKEINEKLPQLDFVRVNRSSILPVNRIESIRNKTVYLSDRTVPIGNTYIEEFLKRFPER